MNAGRRFDELPPLALYVHFPWCVAKCPYCDFNSYTLRDTLPEDRYIATLLEDLRAQLDSDFGRAAQLAGRNVISVFFGGGTPSLFSPDAIGGFIEQMSRVLTVAADAEVTLEANPGTIERGRFAGYRAAGVNRISLGAQSFDARKLAALGRIHSPTETIRAAEELHAAGLSNFNLDLMYGLPEQTAEQAVADVTAALALQPAHLSHYHLTMEPGTPFAASPPPLPAEDSIDEMLAECQQTLSESGFGQYEVSAYARAERRCVHNLNYWQFGDYLGVGAGAHGKLTGPGLEIRRTTQWREPRKYLGAGPSGRTEVQVVASQRPFEFMLNALRLVNGFRDQDYEARTGLPIQGLVPTLTSLASRGLLQREDQGWRCTATGLRFLNDVLLSFLPNDRNYAQASSTFGK